jgi:hypothetical protein
VSFLLSLIVGLVVVGVALYLISLLPIDPAIATIIRVVVIVAVIIWLFHALGVLAAFGGVGS